MSVIVAFVSKKGGVGKSTLARALATVAVRRGLSTTLADLDPGQQTSARWQRLRKRNLTMPSLTVKAFSNVDSAIASEQDADLLIVDGPGQAPGPTEEITSIAHVIVQPSGASFDELQPAVELFYGLSDSGVPKSRLHIALSRMLDPNEERAARQYIEIADFNVLPGVIPEHAQYRAAHNRGLAFIEAQPQHPSAALMLDALVTKIIDKLGTLSRHRADAVRLCQHSTPT